MTEAEWLAEPDFTRHLQFVEPRLSQRKSRLLAAALCRAGNPADVHPDLPADLDVIERYADGRASGAELENARQRCRVLAIRQFEISARAVEADIPPRGAATLPIELGWALAWALAFAATTPHSIEGVARRVMESVPLSLAHTTAELCRDRVFDVAGNPFAPVTFDPGWRTSTAVSLARGMYESRDFGAMPILADALQDAGCDSDDVLNHCRDAKLAHVRGCWVLDGVLGKE